MATTIKITQLPSIGNGLSANTILPVVNTTGTAITAKVAVGNIANFILTEAGNLLSPALVSNIAYSVANSAQPNITSVGTLTSLSSSGNITCGNISTGVITLTNGATIKNTAGNAIAIGYLAGNTNQANNSIILNATGAVLNQTTANTFTVKPVRNGGNTGLPAGFYQMAYNPTTGEIVYYT